MRVEGNDLACVLGDMDLVRPLALAGIRCVTVATTNDPLRFSRSSAASLDWIDHWRHQDILVERLMSFGLSQPSRPALFYQTTGDLLMVSRHRERLREAFRFIIADAELVEEVTDKARFHALAGRLNLPVPPTRRLSPAADPGGWQIDLEFPLVVKPVTRHYERWSRVDRAAKAVRVDSEAALRTLWPRLADTNLEILAQELIPGPESRIESYHVYVDETGHPAAYFTGRKIRTRPSQFGHSTSVMITDAPDVAELGAEIAKRLGLRGTAKFDFKRTPGNELRLLEVNPRLTLWNHAGAVAGVNIPAMVFADLMRRERPAAEPVRPGVTWCDLWEDAAAARESGQLDVSWFRFALACEAKSGFAWNDPMPFLRGVAAPRLANHARKRATKYLSAARRRRARTASG